MSSTTRLVTKLIERRRFMLVIRTLKLERMDEIGESASTRLEWALLTDELEFLRDLQQRLVLDAIRRRLE